jgi:hypothetical protein
LLINLPDKLEQFQMAAISDNVVFVGERLLSSRCDSFEGAASFHGSVLVIIYRQEPAIAKKSDS